MRFPTLARVERHRACLRRDGGELIADRNEEQSMVTAFQV